MRGSPVLFARFIGGVNALDAPYNLRDSGIIEARDSRNFVSRSKNGALRKRDGSVLFATPPAGFHSLYAMQEPDWLIGGTGALLYKVSTLGVVTSLTTAVTSGLPWSFVQGPVSGGQGPLYGVNGTDTPKQWTGAGALADWTAASGSVPNGKHVLYHGNRIWIALGSRLYWSELIDPRNWPAANVNDFEPEDGEEITGLGTLGPHILVFKRSKTWLVTDLDSGANRQLSKSVGCVSARSIAETPRGTFFLSKDQGVMNTSGQAPERVSDRVRPLIDMLQPGQRENAAGAFFDNHYYLSISTTGISNDLTLDYDFELDSWWPHTLAAQQWVIWEAGSTPELYGARGGAAAIDRALVDGETQDHATNFTAYWLGPFHSFGSPHLRKRVRRIHFDGEGRIAVGVGRDFYPESLEEDVDFASDETLFGGTGTFGGEGTFGDPAVVREAEILTPGVARAWSLEIGNATDDPIEVNSYTFLLQERKG